MKCPKCKRNTLKHLHDTAHGIPRTHLVGSERYECVCGFYVFNKEEGREFGLKFIKDIK